MSKNVRLHSEGCYENFERAEDSSIDLSTERRNLVQKPRASQVSTSEPKYQNSVCSLQHTQKRQASLKSTLHVFRSREDTSLSSPQLPQRTGSATYSKRHFLSTSLSNSLESSNQQSPQPVRNWKNYVNSSYAIKMDSLPSQRWGHSKSKESFYLSKKGIMKVERKNVTKKCIKNAAPRSAEKGKFQDYVLGRAEEGSHFGAIASQEKTVAPTT